MIIIAKKKERYAQPQSNRLCAGTCCGNTLSSPLMLDKKHILFLLIVLATVCSFTLSSWGLFREYDNQQLVVTKNAQSNIIAVDRATKTTKLPKIGVQKIVEDDDNRTLTNVSTTLSLPAGPSCSREQIRQGHWEIVHRNSTPYIPVVSWERSCYNRHGLRQGQLEQSPYVDFVWALNHDQSLHCSFESEFTVERFCHVVGSDIRNRTIAFLGDSITWQQYNSLSYLSHSQDVYRKTPQCLSQACNGTVNMFWQRDNFARDGSMDRLVQRFDPDVIVFNRGAHYKDDKTVLSELNDTLVSARKWQANCEQQGRRCVLFWRSTYPGIPNCAKIPGPLSNRSISEALVQNLEWYEEVEKRLRFHWWNFADQNKLVEELIQEHVEHHQLQIKFIDFYEMAMMRPDNHIDKNDCLHWCLPGPMDAANNVLLHKLEDAWAGGAHNNNK